MLKQKYKIYILILPIAIIAIGCYLISTFSKTDSTGSSAVIIDTEAKTTSEEPTAQANFSDGDDSRDPGNSLSDDDGSGTIVDSGDMAPERTDDPVVSDDGKTALYYPERDQTISSGSLVSGNTKNDNVYFRLLDSKTGVIGEGKLKSDSKGDFSGKFNIENHSNEGRLDIFSRSPDGTEYSTIYINVRFENG
jgi:hypothetical protein